MEMQMAARKISRPARAAPANNAGTGIEDDHGFRMSRVYAEGWNTARRISGMGGDPMEQDRERLNPYSDGPKHTRWDEGYCGAFAGPRLR